MAVAGRRPAPLCLGPARAGDAGHYVGGMMDIRDYFVPDPGFYAALYNYFYTSDRYNDQNGNRVSSTTLPDGSGSPVSVNLDMYVLAPAFIWASPWKVLGAKYGAYIAPTFANSSLNAVASTVRGRGGTASQATFAPGDLFVQPVWLGWSFSHWDFSAAYGFYAPVGKYSTEKELPPLALSTCRPRTISVWVFGRSSFRAQRPGTPGRTGPRPSPWP